METRSLVVENGEFLKQFSVFPTLSEIINKELWNGLCATKEEQQVIITGNLQGYRLSGILCCVDGKEKQVEVHYGLLGTLTRYSELKSMGCAVPWYSEGWQLWNETVTITERIYPVKAPYDVKAMTIQLLKQLQYVHRFYDKSAYRINRFGQTEDGRYYLAGLDIMGQSTGKGDLLCLVKDLAQLNSEYDWLVARVHSLHMVHETFYQELIEELQQLEKAQIPLAESSKERTCCSLS